MICTNNSALEKGQCLYALLNIPTYPNHSEELKAYQVSKYNTHLNVYCCLTLTLHAAINMHIFIYFYLRFFVSSLIICNLHGSARMRRHVEGYTMSMRRELVQMIICDFSLPCQNYLYFTVQVLCLSLKSWTCKDDI